MFSEPRPLPPSLHGSQRDYSNKEETPTSPVRADLGDSAPSSRNVALIKLRASVLAVPLLGMLFLDCSRLVLLHPVVSSHGGLLMVFSLSSPHSLYLVTLFLFYP